MEQKTLVIDLRDGGGIWKKQSTFADELLKTQAIVFYQNKSIHKKTYATKKKVIFKRVKCVPQMRIVLQRVKF
jgi:hypothetical protein